MRSTRAQSCRRRWTSSHSSVGGGRDLLGGPAEEARQRRRRARASARSGRSSASSSRSHSRAAAVREDAAGAVDDRRDAGVVERVADERGVAVGRARAPRRGPGRTRSRSSVAPSSERCSISRRDDSSATRSAARSCATCSRADALVAKPGRRAGRRRLVAVHDADAQRRRSGAPCRRGVWLAFGGADAAVDDPLVAELGAAEQRVVGVDQPLVAAPVDVERRACRGGLRRPRR